MKKRHPTQVEFLLHAYLILMTAHEMGGYYCLQFSWEEIGKVKGLIPGHRAGEMELGSDSTSEA